VKKIPLLSFALLLGFNGEATELGKSIGLGSVDDPAALGFDSAKLDAVYEALKPNLVYSEDRLLIDGAVGRDYELLSSSDLKRWQVLETVTINESPHVYVDETAVEAPARFYRLQSAE
jgi:hypothetical protein